MRVPLALPFCRLGERERPRSQSRDRAQGLRIRTSVHLGEAGLTRLCAEEAGSHSAPGLLQPCGCGTNDTDAGK